MDKVWLSTRYYTDDKFDGISATSERMFSRLLSLAGSLENMGKVPAKPWVFVGLPNGKRSVFDLVDRGILRQLPDGTFEFPAWAGWQDKGDDLAERKKADRERKRRQREREREETAYNSSRSRDKSVTVTLPEERRGDKERENVTSPPHVSNARDDEPHPPEPPADDEHATRGSLALVPSNLPARQPNGRRIPKQTRQQALAALNATARSQTALHISEAFAATLNGTLDRKTLIEIGHVADELITDGVDPRQIAAGLTAWQQSDSWSPTQIRRFVAKAATPTTPRGVGKPTTKALDHLAIAEQLIAEMDNQP